MSISSESIDNIGTRKYGRKNKSGFHTVGDTADMEEYNRKIKEHRRKVLRRTVIVTAVFFWC